ncbi:hypothetical protein QN277_020689 [Acacia crassicarpa]|uniref:Glycosyltransferase n=1 Tax=Acacia crassicarpa TaxID=499986 RepID=A0AAE1KF95_9FABA|nr:hypothetical protein QN277_020689 [Acacia crassicarpa]
MGLVPCEGGSCQFPTHVLLFPFMAKGHTIPLFHFARLLLRRNTFVTVITTPANRPFVTESLQNTTASIIDLPFPANVPDIPPGVESTDKLPSMSLFYKFATATVHMQPHFEHTLETLPSVSFIVSDGFLWWTQHSASKFSIRRLVYYGMSSYVEAVGREAVISGIFSGPQPDDEPVMLNRFPWIRISKNDYGPEFRNPDPKSLSFEFHMNVFSSQAKSFGMVVNTFYELEPVFIDYLKKESGHKSYYCVGPLCLEEEPRNNKLSVEFRKPTWMEWLDKKQQVLYVAFGSQAEISTEQLKEIVIGLEESEVEFMWVIRKKEWELPQGFEERVEERGMIVREWVDQREILKHKSVKGFLSHCGWNSVLEGICGGVPILAWPMMAEQHLNAKMVEEEIKVGLRVDTCHGSMRGFVKGEGVRKMVRELMEGGRGREARKKVAELAETAKKAVAEGGSSCRALDSMLVEACGKKESAIEGRNGNGV